jgi:hypothetical protein
MYWSSARGVIEIEDVPAGGCRHVSDVYKGQAGLLHAFGGPHHISGSEFFADLDEFIPGRREVDLLLVKPVLRYQK